jgi:hypothetical protein
MLLMTLMASFEKGIDMKRFYCNGKKDFCCDEARKNCNGCEHCDGSGGEFREVDYESEWLQSSDGVEPIRCKRCNTPALYRAEHNEFGDFEVCRHPSKFCPYCGAKMKGE